MSDADSKKPPGEVPTTPLTPGERALLAVLGVAAAGAGGVAVFRTDNELGTAGLLLIAVLFLVMAVAQVVPTGFQYGTTAVTLRRAAADALFDDAPEELQAEAIRNVALGQSATPQDLKELLDRFVRFQSSEHPRRIYDELVARGWQPLSPPGQSTYIRWRYAGPVLNVTLYQNSQALVAAQRAIRQYAQQLPGAEVRTSGEVQFLYLGDTSNALGAADALARYAQGEPTSVEPEDA